MVSPHKMRRVLGACACLTVYFWFHAAPLFAADDELGDMFSDVPSEEGDTEDEEEVEEFQSDSMDLLVERKHVKFPGWGPYIRNIRIMCEGMAKDGRNLLIKSTLDPRIAHDPSCAACYPLFKLFAHGCQQKKEKKTRKAKATEVPESQSTEVVGEAPAAPSAVTPPPLVRQREPSILVQVSMSEFLGQLLSDEKRLEEGKKAIKKIDKYLLEAEKKFTVGERDYLSWFHASFADFFDQIEHEDGGDGAGDVKNEAVHVGKDDPNTVNELFDYE